MQSESNMSTSKYTKYLISEQPNGIPMYRDEEWIFEVNLGMSNDQWHQIEPVAGWSTGQSQGRLKRSQSRFKLEDSNALWLVVL